MLAYHAFFMAATAVIVARGIAGGIEAAGKFLMPLLAALMLLLAGYCDRHRRRRRHAAVPAPPRPRVR